MDVDLRLGAEVAGHRLERVIGRGGMSVVYLAEHLRLGRKVAFKVLAPHVAEDPGFRERFIRESRTAAGLDHPNIVTVYDAGEFDGLLYISMRYVEGSDLGHVLGETGALEPWRTLTIVSQVGSALDAAHAEGLVHRDVKPGNILLSQPDTPLERSFLSDFGVTKRMTTAEALTRTGQFVGTVDYVAPEQILGEPVDGRADVYSLGCVLYQCLSGRIPFPRPTDVATIYAHLHDETPDLPEGTYPGMDPVIARALAKDKEQRYPTCTALVEAARSNLHGNAPTEVRIRPESAVADTEEMTSPRRPRGRRPRWIIAAAVVAIAGLTTAAIAFAGRDRGTHGATPPTSPTSPTGGQSTTSGPVRLTWNLENRSKFAHVSGQVAFWDAIEIADHQVIAVGHADNAVDEDAVVWTKVGRTWRPQFIAGQNVPGDQKLEGITQLIGGRLVVVGYDTRTSAVAYYSDDQGSSWTPATGLDGGPDAKTVVQSPDGTIWAIGVGTAWTSTNGATWTRSDTSAFSEGFAWKAIVDGNDVVAVGSAGPTGARDAAAWLLHDGTWTQADPAPFTMDGGQYLRDVSRDPEGRLVAVGTDYTDPSHQRALAWTSEDGLTWQASAPIPGGVDDGLDGLLFVPGQPGSFVAGGWTDSGPQRGAAVWYSTDGSAWVRERREFATYDLVGPGRAIRALVQYGAGDIAVYAFGVQGVGKSGKPRLWQGKLG